jgi:phosphatidylinositol-bisphosphatase
LAEKQLVGMFLTVYVKEKLCSKVKEIKYESLGLGAMGTMGNKGGIGIRFRVFQTTFVFITSHFIPHMGGTAKRNQNFADILSQLDFGGQIKPDTHDYFFWCGDLNYRIENLDGVEVRRLIKSKQWTKLLEHDQLMTERMSGRVFLGFKEGEITFAPTYKYDPGTLTYDTSEKQRIPSWTDRILWKGKKRDRVKIRTYGRYELLISDHLPVSALYEVEALSVIEHRYRACRESLIKEYDDVPVNENEVPKITLSTDTFNFNNVAYEVPRTEILELFNSGSVVCEFQFVATEAGQDEICKPWIKVTPTQGLIIPGKTVQVQITVLVDRMTAPDLNTTDGTLEDTLLIHVENGTSCTVNISGNFLRTCFGNSLRNLIHIHGPARNMNPDDLTNGELPRLPIPKEIYKLVDYLSKYALRTPGLLSTPADQNEVDLVRDMMDRGESLSLYNGSAHAVLECLVNLLESLPQPLIPYKHYKLCIEHHQNADMLVEVVAKLPPVHYNVFQYLMAFLRELLVHCDANGLTSDHISHTCCDSVLRTPLNMPEGQQRQDRYAKLVFIKTFLRDDQEYLIGSLPKKELFRQT